MSNGYPCTNCKCRHRKCIYTDDSEECLLCMQMEVECIPYELPNNEQPLCESDLHIQHWRQQINQLDCELDTFRERTKECLRWDLLIVNDNIHIASRIWNLEELVEYNQASIRYLSPFQQFFQRENIQFKGVSASVAMASTGLIVRHTVLPKTMRRVTYHGFQDIARKRMDSLINLYMERYNSYVGFLHRPSFLTYYHELDDPLSSPLALAVCVDCISYFYPRLNYSIQEKRDMADFFYVRCKDTLFDMYDDPKGRVEAILASNMLMQYLLDVLLEYAECRRLATISLLAIYALEPKDLSYIQNTLVQRARVNFQLVLRLIDLVIDEKFDYRGIATDMVYELDDEPPELHTYFAMWRHILKLIGSEYITLLMERVRNSVLRGHSCEMSLDFVLQYEPTIQKWWKSLPLEFRICEDPFDLNASREAIENVPSSTHMIPLALVHGITVMTQSTLLQPYPTIHGPGGIDMIDILRKRSLSLTLCSTQALIYVMKKNLEVDIEAMPLSFGYMIGVLHAVCNIFACQHIHLPSEMQTMLVYCFTQLHSVVPPDHQVPESAAKLSAFVKNYKSNPGVVYHRFPMPRLAMLSDILHTCFRQIKPFVTT